MLFSISPHYRSMATLSHHSSQMWWPIFLKKNNSNKKKKKKLWMPHWMEASDEIWSQSAQWLQRCHLKVFLPDDIQRRTTAYPISCQEPSALVSQKNEALTWKLLWYNKILALCKSYSNDMNNKTWYVLCDFEGFGAERG